MQNAKCKERERIKQFGDNLANHMAYIYTAILYDKYGMSLRKLQNFYGRVEGLRFKALDPSEELTFKHLIEYCDVKKINARQYVNSIPFSQKIFLADVSNKQRAVIGMDKNINIAFYTTIILVMPVLKETYKFSNKKIYEFLEYVKDYVDSYWRKQPGTNQRYLSDEILNQMFIDEVGYDLEKGEYTDARKNK